MSDQDTTNPVDVADDDVLDTAGVVDEANAQGDDQSQLDDDGNPLEEAEDDSEEIEHKGAKYKLPKLLAKEFREGLLRQEDYTRKTQDVAARAKALETRQAELAQQAEAQTKTLEKRVQLATVDQQLQAYQALDWQAYAGQYGAEAATAAMAQWQSLRDHRQGLNDDITRAEQDHRLHSERSSATALQEADQLLARELQGYGPDLVAKVAQTAQSYGVSPEELRESFIGPDGKADVRSFKIIARLQALEAENASLKSKQTKAQHAEKQTAVQPARTVGQKAGGYKPGLDDSLPPDEWVRRRNAQLAKRA